MILTVGKNGAIPLPDELCEDSKLSIGDILIGTIMEDNPSIKLEKFEDQTLSDKQIEEHGSLTRAEVTNPKDL